jgi:hypothetical protein
MVNLERVVLFVLLGFCGLLILTNLSGDAAFLAAIALYFYHKRNLETC